MRVEGGVKTWGLTLIKLLHFASLLAKCDLRAAMQLCSSNLAKGISISQPFSHLTFLWGQLSVCFFASFLISDTVQPSFWHLTRPCKHFDTCFFKFSSCGVSLQPLSWLSQWISCLLIMFLSIGATGRISDRWTDALQLGHVPRLLLESHAFIHSKQKIWRHRTSTGSSRTPEQMQQISSWFKTGNRSMSQPIILAENEKLNWKYEPSLFFRLCM